MVAGGQYRTPNEIQPASGCWFEILSFELIWDASRAGGPPGFRDAYILQNFVQPFIDPHHSPIKGVWVIFQLKKLKELPDFVRMGMNNLSSD